jgi:23S rRNA (cytosine1962-C5)-methyltransferase
MYKIILDQDREKSLLRRHPWIFSKAIAKIEGNPQSGETVEIYSSIGSWLARGSYSPESQIRVRIWTFDQDQKINEKFFEDRIRNALDKRQQLIKTKELSAYRLIAAESDGLPGTIIDIYNNYIVCELLSAGIEFQRKNLFSALKKIFPDFNIYERSDVAVRKKEGLQERKGVISGEEPPEMVEISENNGMKIFVDLKNGHKTGYYLDQRDNRASLQKYCDGAKVLNCFCYTGGFSLYALKGHAKQVYNVDVSRPALEIAKKNIMNNHLDIGRVKFLEEDVFKYLRRLVEQKEKFDVIVLDPPKFIENKNQLVRGSRGYKDINMLAFKLLNHGGVLQTYSCSGLMTPELFQKIVADAALDAGVNGQIIEKLSQASDHPVALPYPEGLYLKGLTVKVD